MEIPPKMELPTHRRVETHLKMEVQIPPKMDLQTRLVVQTPPKIKLLLKIKLPTLHKMDLPTRHRMVLPITIVPQIQTLPIVLLKTKVLNPIVAPQVTEETQTMALLLLLFHSKETGISTMRL